MHHPFAIRRIGLILPAAVALSATAYAAPRVPGDAAARGKDKVSVPPARLVTGDPARINAVVAGTGPTTILAVNPVNPPTGLPAYPAGVTINGNELTIDRNNKDGFRAWFNVQLSNWDPNNDGPPIGSYQVKIDCTNYVGVHADPPNPGVDLIPAFVPCPGGDPTPCVAAFGESWAPCGFNAPYVDICEPGYLDPAAGRPDSWCAPSGGGCAQSGVAVATCDFLYFAVSNAGLNGHPDQDGTCVGGARNGQGCNTTANCAGAPCTGPKLANYYAGTLVLDLPAQAKGKYTVLLNENESFVATPEIERLDSVVESGFVINYVTGKLGDVNNDGCVDLSDFAVFQRNFDGPDCSVPQSLEETGFAVNFVTGKLGDVNNDGCVDLRDFAVFQRNFDGPDCSVPPE